MFFNSLFKIDFYPKIEKKSLNPLKNDKYPCWQLQLYLDKVGLTK